MKRIQNDMDLNEIKISQNLINQDYFLLLLPSYPFLNRSMAVSEETMP